MAKPQVPILILALGNDLLGDDGVALFAARQLKEDVSPQLVDVTESSEAGLALMEMMTGYRKVLLLDSIQTRQSPPGTILEFGVEDFKEIVAPSPHYAGLPEVLNLAERLNIPFPGEIKILAMEVANPFEFCQKFSADVEEGLQPFIDKARSILSQWEEESHARILSHEKRC